MALGLAALLLFGACLAITAPADAHWQKLTWEASPARVARVHHSVRQHFHRPRSRHEAMHVISCESKGDTTAANGQYLGLFQEGEGERATYGFGRSIRAQVHSGAKMFRDTGRNWLRWAQVCRP